MYETTNTSTGSYSSSVEVSKVLRNTYALLAMTILFSAFTATISVVAGLPSFGLLILIPYIALLFAIEKTKNSVWGIVWTFALTGMMGLTLGPLVSYSIGTNGFGPLIMALGGTAAIFFGLSAYILITKKDMSKMTGFIMTGLIIMFVAGIANVFLQISALALVISCGFLLLSSLLIMWQTSNIIHGGERNYISATVTLYISLYNIFTILLSFLSGDD